jgi:hypothetical protein
VSGLTNPQADAFVCRIGFNTSKKLAQSLKRVGLQAVEKGIHGWYYPLYTTTKHPLGTHHHYAYRLLPS